MKPDQASARFLKMRDTEHLYGVHPVLEALAAGRRKVHGVLVARGGKPGDLEAAAKTSGVPVVEAPKGQLDDAIPAVHQGVVAVASRYPYANMEVLLKPAEGFRRVLVLDQIQDPQNLGAILRTAEAVGVGGVVIARHGSAEVTPAAVKASAGASEHLSVVRVRNIADALAELKEAGFWSVGLDAAGENLLTMDLKMDVALVVGSEGKGLRPRVAQACDFQGCLPMSGRVTSLNASAATAAALYTVLAAQS